MPHGADGNASSQRHAQRDPHGRADTHGYTHEPAISNTDRAVGNPHAAPNAHCPADGDRDGDRSSISNTHRIGHANADRCSHVDEYTNALRVNVHEHADER
jgi:hypothetical protein